ncbi:hypothetical protein NUW54_g8309 [Trametes sanguinea]|uniref:Uncharacterized protein n=1 Tax=Trametes sanguinea TaxID=158606 RepID=A0ACC1PG12_9APHY|nr:hypothetical protein NUW54_g8309 [Trametes sanguinea]
MRMKERTWASTRDATRCCGLFVEDVIGGKGKFADFGGRLFEVQSLSCFCDDCTLLTTGRTGSRTSTAAAMTKYILVSGGVVSGIGKGVIASSTGLLLKTTGLKVTAIKIDPYMNIDAGTMRPQEHGEVYVLNDGGEVDLDLGNYERYLNVTLSRDNNITTGKIYREVIEKETGLSGCRRSQLTKTGEEPDVCIVELVQAFVSFAAGLFQGVVGFVAANFFAVVLVGGLYYWWTHRQGGNASHKRIT